jgi:DNA-binding LacI/PurR family transcriptional regulator
MRTLYGSGFPCVALDLPIEGPRATYVTSDNYAGAAEAVRYLHSLGHREIATITGPVDSLPAVQRLAGYHEAIRELGMTTRPEYVETGDFFLDTGYASALRLAALPNRPTAVFVAGDEMAIGAMHAFNDAGVSIPGDIAVVGFDDIEAASLVRPALTTIAQDPIALGAAAVEALLTFVDAPAPGAGAATAMGAGGTGVDAGVGVGGSSGAVGLGQTLPTPWLAKAAQPQPQSPSQAQARVQSQAQLQPQVQPQLFAPRTVPTRLVRRQSCTPKP